MVYEINFGRIRASFWRYLFSRRPINRSQIPSSTRIQRQKTNFKIRIVMIVCGTLLQLYFIWSDVKAFLNVDQLEKLWPCFRIITKAAKHTTSDCPAFGLLDASHNHAHVWSLDYNTYTSRFCKKQQLLWYEMAVFFVELLNYTYLWPLKRLRQFLWSTSPEPNCKHSEIYLKIHSEVQKELFIKNVPAAFSKIFLLFCKVLTVPALYPLVNNQYW